jgi:hypothetical protein
VHGRDAKAHGDRPEANAQVRRLRRVGRIDAEPDHDHADQERRQRGQDEIVDGARKAGGEQADEMHRPNTCRQRQRRSGKEEAASQPGCAVEFGGKGKTDKTALNRDRDRKRDEPRIMRNWHSSPRFLPRVHYG